MRIAGIEEVNAMKHREIKEINATKKSEILFSNLLFLMTDLSDIQNWREVKSNGHKEVLTPGYGHLSFAGVR